MKKPNKAAQALAKRRMVSMTAARRSEIAKLAANTRWNKAKKLSTKDPSQ